MLNREISLMELIDFLILFHVIIWIIAILGGIFGKAIIRFNVLILLPCIYLFQMLPIHLIILKKIELILKTTNYKKTPCKAIYFDKCYEETLAQKISEKLSVPKDDIVFAIRYLKCKEYDYVIPYYIDVLRQRFKDSFMNPFSAQGFIIIGYILNALFYLIYS